MSKLGKKPIMIPDEIVLKLEKKEVIAVGKTGTLNLKIPEELEVSKEGNFLLVKIIKETPQAKILHGTYRQLTANLLKGVTEGWRKDLEIRGTGFKAGLEGETLVLTLGFSHPVKITPPPGVKFEVKENKISVIGPDKAQVGLLADKIRKVHPPDFYKGKGIRYLGEEIKLKPGKTAKVGAGGPTATGGK